METKKRSTMKKKITLSSNLNQDIKKAFSCSTYYRHRVEVPYSVYVKHLAEDIREFFPTLPTNSITQNVECIAVFKALKKIIHNPKFGNPSRTQAMEAMITCTTFASMATAIRWDKKIAQITNSSNPNSWLLSK